nr:unnamed protein product [Callosobruchus analis]
MKVYVVGKFNKYLDILVFAYFLMWIITMIAVITSNYYYYFYHLWITILTFATVLSFSLCLTATYYRERNRKLKEYAKKLQEKARAVKVEAHCHRIPLTDDDHLPIETHEQDEGTGRTSEKGTSFHGIITVFVFGRFANYLGVFLFIVYLMWLLSIIAIITSDYQHESFHQGIVVGTICCIILFAICVSAEYENTLYLKEKKYRLKLISKDAIEEPDCHRIPLSGGETTHSKTPYEAEKMSADKGTSFHGMTTVGPIRGRIK